MRPPGIRTEKHGILGEAEKAVQYLKVSMQEIPGQKFREKEVVFPVERGCDV